MFGKRVWMLGVYRRKSERNVPFVEFCSVESFGQLKSFANQIKKIMNERMNCCICCFLSFVYTAKIFVFLHVGCLNVVSYIMLSLSSD